MTSAHAELNDVRLLADGLAFPEGPIAMPDGSVVLVEIDAGLLVRIGPEGADGADGAKEVIAETGGGPNGAAIGPDGAVYVCNNGAFRGAKPQRPSIQRVDLVTGEVSELYAEADGIALSAPNDIVFDAEGGFWFTDMKGNAILYARPDGSHIERVVDDAVTPNGVGLSPDGTELYWAQTYTRQLMRRRVVAPGVIEPSPGVSIRALLRKGSIDPWSLVAGLPGATELDSLAVDSAGRVCIGGLVDSGIVVVDPSTGDWQIRRLPSQFADAAVTNICFGGPDLRTAYITASERGRLLAAQWDVPGQPLHFG